MPRIIVSLQNEILIDAPLSKPRTALGRRATNDIVIAHSSVSGEHAAIVLEQNKYFIEDLNSTNGTQVNGKAIKKQALCHNDRIDLAKCRITFLSDTQNESSPEPKLCKASIKILTGAANGREIVLSKAVTTIGKPSIQVAIISKQGGDYSLTHVEGKEMPKINGRLLGLQACPLKDGDLIAIAGEEVLFLLESS